MRTKHSKHILRAIALSTIILAIFSFAAFAQRAPLERTEVGNIVIEPVYTQNDGPLREPIALDFAVDGTIFFIERQGYVNQLNPYTGERIELLHLDVFMSKPGGERELGLMGIALEPGFNFQDKNKIWLYYSPNPENNVMNRLSRFEYKIGEDGVPYIDPESEQIIFMVYWDRDWCCHPAGDLRFGPDGTLYLSLGDDVNPSGTHGGYGALDTRPGNEMYSALRTAQSATDVRGKILRLNPDGTIPTDNPFYNDSRYHPAVYAIGFRNPYRIHIDPVTGWVLYGDNNPDARVVDPNRGPAGISEWGVVTEPGQNHGWPYCIGANEPYMNYDYATGINHGPFDCSSFTPAYVWQEYTLMWQFPQLGQGGSSPISGVILRRPAPDAKYQWSEEYLNHWYPADFTRGFILKFELYDNGTRLPKPSNWYDYDLQAPDDYHQVPPPEGSIEVWLPYFHGPIDLRQSPDGALYLVDYGRSFFRANPEAAIYRIYDKEATARGSSGGAVEESANAASVVSTTSVLADEFNELNLDVWELWGTNPNAKVEAVNGQLRLSGFHTSGWDFNQRGIVLREPIDLTGQVTTITVKYVQAGHNEQNVAFSDGIHHGTDMQTGDIWNRNGFRLQVQPNSITAQAHNGADGSFSGITATVSAPYTLTWVITDQGGTFVSEVFVNGRSVGKATHNMGSLNPAKLYFYLYASNNANAGPTVIDSVTIEQKPVI